MMRFLTLFNIFFILAAWAAPAAEAAVIRITQPKIELELAPGQTHSGELEVENPTEDSLALRIYLEDWKYKGNGSGEKEFAPAGTLPRSASKWITFTPADASMTPFSKLTVRYTVNVPADAAGGNYSVMFFETMLGEMPDPNQEGAHLRVAGRIGALFFIHIKGTVEKKGEVASVKVTPPAGNAPMAIETTFENTGNVDVTLGGNLLIMDADGKVVGRGEIQKLYTFPGTTDARKTEWVGRLPKGTYDLLLTYDMGQGQAIVKEEKFEVV